MYSRTLPCIGRCLFSLRLETTTGRVTFLNSHGPSIKSWPFEEIVKTAKAAGRGTLESQIVQYTTEHLARELFVNPDSYLPSTEHHLCGERKTHFSCSDFGKAKATILDSNGYDLWESVFGL